MSWANSQLKAEEGKPHNSAQHAWGIDLSGMSIMNFAKEAHMPHKPWKRLLCFLATSLALAIVTLITLAADSK